MLTGIALAHALLASACGGGGGGAASAGHAPPPSTGVPTPAPLPAPAPVPAPAPAPAPSPAPDCQTRDIYTLCVTVLQGNVSATTIERLKEQFFIVYPLLVDRFNHGAPLAVDFVIGPLQPIANAGGNKVTYQATYFTQHPEDIGVVAHELMHIVQNYLSAPSWITEGIADYARYYYGAKNEAAGWILHPPQPGEGFGAGYQVTARFLIWIEERYDVALVDALDADLRDGVLDSGIWVSMTGKALGDLWNEYVADPALEGT
jgi:hypothetical protein